MVADSLAPLPFNNNNNNNNNGSLWVLIILFAYLWILMGPYGSL